MKEIHKEEIFLLTCFIVDIYIYIYIDWYIDWYINTHRKVIKKILSHTKILHLLYASYIFMCLACMEIKTEIWISFSRCIRRDSALPK